MTVVKLYMEQCHESGTPKSYEGLAHYPHIKHRIGTMGLQDPKKFFGIFLTKKGRTKDKNNSQKFQNPFTHRTKESIIHTMNKQEIIKTLQSGICEITYKDVHSV